MQQDCMYVRQAIALAIQAAIYYYVQDEVYRTSTVYNDSGYNSRLIRYFNFMFQQLASANRSKDKGRIYCCMHAQRTAKYHNPQQRIFYCTACAIQQASRGTPVQEIAKTHTQHFQTPSLSLLQEVYQQSQNDIQQSIKRYNAKYQKLVEAMTDMQIRDLIEFNRKLEENQLMYKQMKEETKHEWNRSYLADTFAAKFTDSLLAKLDSITEQTSNLNVPKASQSRYKPVSPARFSRGASPQQLNKNRSQPLNLKLVDSSNSLQETRLKGEITHSFALSQARACSDHSKTSTVEEIKKDGLEDTPQSVKERVSQQNLKVTSNMAVTMFEKIDICQSINMQEGKQSRGSLCSAKSRHRYDCNFDE